MAKPHPSAAARSDDEVLLDEMIAEISERIRGGESIDIEHYADTHPEIAIQLRQLYPAMQAMANLGFEPEATLSPAAPNAPEDAKQLGTLGGASDPDLWRALRYGQADVSVSSGGDVGKVLVQDGGMEWLVFREGPLLTWGGYFLLGTIHS